MRGWNRFLHQYQKDLKLWLFFLLSLSLFRWIFILSFRDKIDATSGGSDIFATALNGMRYDSMAATYWMLVPFLTGVACSAVKAERLSDRVRSLFGSAFVVLSTALSVVTIGYFREYNEQFNHFLFNLYYDDAKAIFLTVWADYHPILYGIAVGAITYVMLKVKNRFFQNGFVQKETVEKFSPGLSYRILFSLLVLSLLVVGMRGSVGRRPMKRQDAAVTKDEFLNKTVMNPYFALLYAAQDHMRQTGTSGLEAFLPDRDARKAAQYVFSRTDSLNDLDEYLKKYAGGAKNKPAHHVFLVLMESGDAWPLLKKYGSLRLTENLKRLGSEGLHIESFLPASDGTMSSLTAIVTSLPYTGVEINYQATARKAYPSSLAATFRRLGYKTRFFYGGYLSWQRLGDFAKDQGFEEVYGGPHMGKWASMHEWGVDDEYLFDFVASKIDDSEPSFSFILTTSFHPPYPLDVWAKGFPVKDVPADIAPLFDNTVSLKVLGHLWYADRCIGAFVRNAEKKLHQAVFAFTGDHYGRKFINARPDYFERSAVPLILYGKNVLRGISLPKGAAGSHIDIGPTLVELAAPKGFTYYSAGNNLLDPRSRFLGIGWLKIIGPDFIFSAADSKFYPISPGPLPRKLPDVNELKRLFNGVYGIGWRRVKQGPEL